MTAQAAAHAPKPVHEDAGLDTAQPIDFEADSLEATREGEMKLKGWEVAPADVKIVFDEDRGKLWDNALTRRTQDL